MKKIYITPNTEFVKVCGQTSILDSKFGNSHHVPEGDQGDDDHKGGTQGAKPHYSPWDGEPQRVGGLWDD